VLNRSIVTAVLRRGTNSSGFRDLTIPCENFLLPPITVSITTRSYPHAVRRLCVGSAKSKLRRPQVRSRHRVQVQSPISTARIYHT